jgi:hypothetical protein
MLMQQIPTNTNLHTTFRHRLEPRPRNQQNNGLHGPNISAPERNNLLLLLLLLPSKLVGRLLPSTTKTAAPSLLSPKAQPSPRAAVTRALEKRCASCHAWQGFTAHGAGSCAAPKLHQRVPSSEAPAPPPDGPGWPAQAPTPQRWTACKQQRTHSARKLLVLKSSRQSRISQPCVQLVGHNRCSAAV